ncbi:MAG: methyltransferase domain-containing protein [Rhodospirillaceae bacterium]|jgi:ubiquinone/menaquinone biosynthesis C-methylase UbiE|nr:methyltransferase domain-containing protein [Rhodospirillaceae bacterium]MBT5079037.1 methyltransferase domain-containing protein [Rhodospirillaceae bacterium]MBT5523136.1 methyltransferase domain-containing protein [Rhodospirillaceae bacterium]MBT5879299.1 methyltransferase domain-containing protein [Rhodospirillaceae bacterium]MBT6589645.1 methyltransferase domain-containing protein [Rhodospirillaceae bacterium]
MPEKLKVEARLAALFEHLGLERAHFGVQNSAELDPIIAAQPERFSSLALIGLNRLQAEVVAPVADRLILMYGDGGAGVEAMATNQPALPEAESHCFKDYTVLTWSDVAADRGAEIVPRWRDFLDRAEARAPASLINTDKTEGEVAGITYRLQGNGPALVLLPMLLSPSQWEPIIERLAERYCVISLGGRHLGGVGFIDGRGTDPGYLRGVRMHVDEIGIQPGQTVLDVGCGPGSLDRWLARYTKGTNPITSVDINGYFLREAAAIAKAEGVGDIITFGPGNAEDLPFDDASFDVVMSHTVMEECNAEKMLAEMIRVAKPGGKVAVMVRAVDMRSLWNLPVSAAIKDKVEAPVPSVGEGGCADASLYTRFGQSGLIDLKLFPTTMTVNDPDGYTWKYYEPYLFSMLDKQEIAEWHAAKRQAIADKSILLARWLHCAVGTKPA